MSKFDEMITVVPRKYLKTKLINLMGLNLFKMKKLNIFMKQLVNLKQNVVVTWKKILHINNSFHIAY